MNTFLILTAVIIVTCVLLNNASFRIGMPVLLAFILLGIFFGNSTFLPIKPIIPDRETVGDLCTVALVFIMFYGGFGTSWHTARPVAVEACLLATAGVVTTAGMVGLCCHFLFHWSWVESLMIGAVLCSTDAATVFSILRSRKLGLKNNIAPLLEVESGSNDPCSYMLTILMCSVMKGQASVGNTIGLLCEQLGFGLFFGVLIAILAVFAMKRLTFMTSGFNSLFLTAVAIASYAIPAVCNGNGYLSAYIVGIILGNQNFDNKKELVNFFDGITGLMQVLIFFMLGLLVRLDSIGPIILPALGVFIILLFIARPVSVFMILAPFRKYKLGQLLLISFCGLRGAASIVFAIIATVECNILKHDIFNLVFFVVLISIALQGSFIPKVAGKLKLIDHDIDVMKTFSDFSEEVDLQFSSVKIDEDCPWTGRQVKDLGIPKDMLLCTVVQQGGEKIVPNGNTLLENGDLVIVCSKSFKSSQTIRIIKHTVSNNSVFDGRELRDMPYAKGQIIMIQRDGKTIIPHGSTVLKSGDALYINQSV